MAVSERGLLARLGVGAVILNELGEMLVLADPGRPEGGWWNRPQQRWESGSVVARLLAEGVNGRG